MVQYTSCIAPWTEAIRRHLAMQEVLTVSALTNVLMCLPTYLLGDARPNTIADFKNSQFPLDALETDGDCNGANQFTYEVPDVQFYSSNTDVVTISGHTATLVDAGDAEITASWDGGACRASERLTGCSG